MQNVEIKCPLPDPELMILRLHALGAVHEWSRRQQDTFFRVERGWLKLREEEGQAPQLISYERPTDETVRFSEYDLATLDDAELWKRLLGRVLDVEAVVEKQRDLWMHANTRIHLDHVNGLGHFVELETLTRTIEPDEARKEVERIIDALALHRSDFIGVPYRILLEQGRESTPPADGS